MQSESNYLTCESYSEELLISFLASAQETCIDVGAGSGRLTRFLSARCAEVHAFECNPKHIGAIEKGMGGAWAKWSKSSNFDNINLHKMAASSEDGRTVLRAPKDSYGWGTIESSNKLQRKKAEGVDEFEVDMCRIDTLGRFFNSVGLLKIDVEGHEPEVLVGAKKLLSQFQPALYLEIYEGHSPGVSSKVREILGAFGYEGCYLRDGQILPIEQCDFTSHLNNPPSQCDINFIFTKGFIHKDRIAEFLDYSVTFAGKVIEVRPEGFAAI